MRGVHKPEQEVTFYSRPNYTGDAHTYAVGTDENLHPGELNDKFKSVKVGRKAKVLAWQDSNPFFTSPVSSTTSTAASSYRCSTT
ncbi:beta/gamma crystallin domain-containing protein [Streptomyces mirabilis]|uniref:beta/gamma crystallin domain-containing protein n=1 Tax=Streptomyces mirabilis TaxID=68239 RepID=UPI00338D8B0F